VLLSTTLHDTVLAPRGWRTHYAGPLPFLGAVFLFTSALSCLVSNAACVVLVYGVLKDLHDGGGLAALRPAQVMLAMMMGASASFATPIGYQTNLMVLQPGVPSAPRRARARRQLSAPPIPSPAPHAPPLAHMPRLPARRLLVCRLCAAGGAVDPQHGAVRRRLHLLAPRVVAAVRKPEGERAGRLLRGSPVYLIISYGTSIGLGCRV